MQLPRALRAFLAARSSHVLAVPALFLIVVSSVFAPGAGSARARAGATPLSAKAVSSRSAALLAHQVFLPAVTGGAGVPPVGPTPTPVVNPTPTPGPSSVGGFWLPFDTPSGDVVPTYGGNVQVDPRGGVHVTDAVWSGTFDGINPAFYNYCPAQCASASSWTRTVLGTNVQDVRLMLDPNGHPRAMFYSTALPNPSGDPAGPGANLHQYQYASCDSNCTSAASWTINVVATVQEIRMNRADNANQYFVLDANGNPAFAYTDDNTFTGHVGTFYAACSSACTTPNATWSEVQISGDYNYFNLSLALSPTGQPRLLYDTVPDIQTDKLGYYACDASCLDPSAAATSWSNLLLYGLQGPATYSLRVDRSGNPRFAFYTGDEADPGFSPDTLYYVWCDSGCTSGAGAWSYQGLGFAPNLGGNVDLLLDGQGLPHLAFNTDGNGPGYAWCATGCTSGRASWQGVIAENASVLQQDWSVYPIYDCSISTWLSGIQPSLALDGAGNPRIAFETDHSLGGQNLGGAGACPAVSDIVLERVLIDSNPQ